jgi:tRNA pseudouridine55 synthase
MHGILLIDKPAGWTSFDVVNYVRKIVAAAENKKPKHVKVGHTGTLDPFATGLLVLLIGKDYTKRAGELSKLPKTYEVTMHLGETSTTGDPEGAILRHPGPTLAPPARAAIEEALRQFSGDLEQTPPAFSAIKVNGQRAYKLARAGKTVTIEPRRVTVHSLELLDYTYPGVTFRAAVSSGTYIRSLVEDIGQMLGTGAYTSSLRRTRVGSFSIQKAVEVEPLQAAVIEQRLQA